MIFDSSLLSIKPNTTSPIDAELAILSKDMFFPITKLWLDKLSNDTNLSSIIKDLKGITISMISSTGQIEEPISNEPAVYWGKYFDFLQLWQVLENIPVYWNDVEYLWLQENVKQKSSNPNEFYLPDYDYIMNVPSTIWGDIEYDTDFFKGLYSSEIAIDQSIGYINSNPYLSVLLHESSQNQNTSAIDDTHAPYRKEVWEMIKAGESIFSKLLKGDVDDFNGFIQYQPVLAILYVHRYCDHLNL